MSWRNGTLIGGILAGFVLVGFLTLRNDPINDQALHALLVGNWRATDVATAAINPRSGPIAKEEFIVRPDGTLRHVIVPERGRGEPTWENYEWKVSGGKLCLRKPGPKSEGLPPIGISVDQSRLRIRSGGFSTKVFERITS